MTPIEAKFRQAARWRPLCRWLDGVHLPLQHNKHNTNHTDQHNNHTTTQQATPTSTTSDTTYAHPYRPAPVMINLPFIASTTNRLRPAAESAAARSPPPASFLCSVRGFIGKAQPTSWLPSRVPLPARGAQDESDAATRTPSPAERRRAFLSTECRNSTGASGLTQTAVLLTSDDYPVGYLDVPPEPEPQREAKTEQSPQAAPARARVTFAEGVSFATVEEESDTAWWERRANPMESAQTSQDEQRRMRATR
jgi:hypothetical protein